MRSFKIFIALICLGLTGLLTEAFITIKSNNTSKPEAVGKGVAVVELFTSEGCSSCPSADALVARVQKENIDKPVYILAFHVDYWNRLGWKDVFSSHEYSDRQNQYARWLKLSQIYTPQVIVNGHTEFVGSDEKSLRSAIKAGLEKPAKTEISLNNIKIEGDKASVQYHATGAADNSSLLIALIEKKCNHQSSAWRKRRAHFSACADSNTIEKHCIKKQREWHRKYSSAPWFRPTEV